MVLISLGLSAALPARVFSVDKRPNILFIMIDDLGWMDLGCQGNKLVETPNIDRLAEEGVRFTDAYAAAPVCSPSRAAIMTGLSPARLRITNHTPDRPSFTPDDATLASAEMHNELPLKYKTVAEHLVEAGYRTGFLGKWHLSGKGEGSEELGPLAQGFQMNIGGCGFGGPPSFFDPYKNPTIKDRMRGEYLPDRLADEAIRFIQEAGDAPFMLFLWNYTVHWPMEAPEHLMEKYESRIGPGLNDTRYGAMIEAMDTSIGKVLDELNRMKLDKETLVVFTSDNGGFGGVADNRPLRLDKGHLYEGGIRVPLIVRWTGRTQAGTVCHEPVIGTDWFRTLLDCSQVELDPDAPEDGTSILPLLDGAESLQRDAIYFHYPNYAFHKSNRLGAAIRSGKWKLIQFFDNDDVELYSLDGDLSEKNNLAESLPEKTLELKGKLRNWLQETNAAMPTRIDKP